MAIVSYEEGYDYDELQRQLQKKIRELGYGNRFKIRWNTTTRRINGKYQDVVKYFIDDQVTGKIYDTIEEAIAAARASNNDVRNNRSRTVNVDPNATAVSVSKRQHDISQYLGTANGSSWTDTAYDVSGTGNAVAMTKAYSDVNSYNQKRGYNILAVDVSVKSGRQVFKFRVVPTGAVYDSFNKAKSVADRIAKHSSEDIVDAIYHCLIDDDFMNLRMSQLRFGKN